MLLLGAIIGVPLQHAMWRREWSDVPMIQPSWSPPTKANTLTQPQSFFHPRYPLHPASIFHPCLAFHLPTTIMVGFNFQLFQIEYNEALKGLKIFTFLSVFKIWGEGSPKGKPQQGYNIC